MFRVVSTLVLINPLSRGFMLCPIYQISFYKTWFQYFSLICSSRVDFPFEIQKFQPSNYVFFYTILTICIPWLISIPWNMRTIWFLSLSRIISAERCWCALIWIGKPLRKLSKLELLDLEWNICPLITNKRKVMKLRFLNGYLIYRTKRKTTESSAQWM